MIDKVKLDDLMVDLGFCPALSGERFLRVAVGMYHPGMQMGELYAGTAAACGSTPSRVERAIRHAKQKALLQGSEYAWRVNFGGIINPNSGECTNGDLVARLHQLTGVDE